jgi:hypothetical protein
MASRLIVMISVILLAELPQWLVRYGLPEDMTGEILQQ